MKRLFSMLCVFGSVISITSFAGGWNWLDPNQDGVMECYYFNDDGTYLTNTTTPDGYLVDENGAWIQDGVVQTKGYDSGALNQAVTNQVLSINPGFTTNNNAKVADNTFGAVSLGALDDDGDEIKSYHGAGAGIWLGLDNRDYTLSEFKTILENSGATNISVKQEVQENVSVANYGGRSTGGNLSEYMSRYEKSIKNGHKGTLLNNVISFTLGGYDFRYYGPTQAKDYAFNTVVVKGIDGEFSDFLDTFNPYAEEWYVNWV